MKRFHRKGGALCFWRQPILPKRAENDKLLETLRASFALFLHGSQEAMHDECIDLAKLSVPENFGKYPNNAKAVLLP